MQIDVVGLDPSMSNFGLVRAKLCILTMTLTELDFTLIKTEKGKGKNFRQNSDDLRRIREISEGTRDSILGAGLAFAELPVGSQSSRGQTNYGTMIGYLAAIQKPMIEVTPNMIKKFVGGKLSTSKAEIIKWAREKHPEAPWRKVKRKGELVFTEDNEHLADAVAAIYVGMQTPEFKQQIEVTKNLLGLN